MPKTYTSLTVANATAGNAILASDFSSLFTNSNNYRVPPMCRVYRSSDLTGYASNTAITWNAEDYDTDGMFTASSTDITINTPGVFLVVLNIYWTASAGVTTHNAVIAANGTPIQSKQSIDVSATGGVVPQTGVFSFPAGTVLTARAVYNGGSAYVIKGNAVANSDANSYISVTWLGQVS
jgi:hypothetical protein